MGRLEMRITSQQADITPVAAARWYGRAPAGRPGMRSWGPVGPAGRARLGFVGPGRILRGRFRLTAWSI